MPYPKFDRNKLEIKRLSERENKVYIERDHVPVNQLSRALGKSGLKLIDKTVSRIRKARDLNRPVMLAFGAHTIKNGMGPTLIALITEGWVTHLATNGAGISIITIYWWSTWRRQSGTGTETANHRQITRPTTYVTARHLIEWAVRCITSLPITAISCWHCITG